MYQLLSPHVQVKEQVTYVIDEASTTFEEAPDKIKSVLESSSLSFMDKAQMTIDLVRADAAVRLCLTHALTPGCFFAACRQQPLQAT